MSTGVWAWAARPCRRRHSKPVAITVIFTLPLSSGSTTAPKMMFASSCGGFLDDGRRGADLDQRQIRPAGDVDDHAARAVHRRAFEQRARDGAARGLHGPVLSFGDSRAVGPDRADDLLRRALSGALSRAGRKRRVVPHRAVGLHPEDRRGALAHPAARPRHRDRLFRVRRRAMRHAREQARDLWPFADHRPLGRDPRRGRRRARRVPREIDPSKVETARKTVPSLQHGRRFGIADPKAGPEHLHLVRGSA